MCEVSEDRLEYAVLERYERPKKDVDDGSAGWVIGEKASNVLHVELTA